MKILLFLLLAVHGGVVCAVPPPVSQLTADCTAPVYASDMLVCEDPGLKELDAQLALRIAENGDVDVGPEIRGDDQDWFRRSRLCAFEADHRDCLVSAYCLRLALVTGSGPLAGTECAPPDGDCIPASTMIQSGFLRKDAEPGTDREILLSGFVDPQNLFGDESVKNILGDWWGGTGPDTATWQFNLKAKETDSAGQSFAVLVPNDLLRDDLLRIFLRDAREGRPTKVCLKGRIRTFDAPTNASTLQGLSVEVSSTRDIRVEFQPPD